MTGSAVSRRVGVLKSKAANDKSIRKNSSHKINNRDLIIIKPALLREECLALAKKGADSGSPVILDEVQKVPDLLDEVHWLIGLS